MDELGVSLDIVVSREDASCLDGACGMLGKCDGDSDLVVDV